MSLTFKDELHAPTPPRARRRRVKDSQPGLFGIRTWKKTRLVMACVFGAISIFPLLYMVSLSFQPTGDILTSHPVLVPTRPTVINYVQAWSGNSFGRYFFNSMEVALGTVLVTVVLASLAALAVVAMFTFNFAWEEFVIALTLINSPTHRTLPIALNFFIGEHTTQWGPLFAASVIATIPSLVVFLISQRSFQRGVSLGGIR